MEKRTGVEAHNWFGDIRWRPSVVVRPASEADIVAVVMDRAAFPAPVRAAGSNHSTTRCVVADAGTVIDMRGMNRILAITDSTVTAQAGALYIDVSRELERHGLQFYVNVELGNLTMGSAACCHTKDASFPGEYGIVSSYAIGMKAVLPNGDVLVVTEEQPELLQAMRTSFGLLGIIFEVTFRVKPLRAMAVHHESFQLDELIRRLPELRATGDSLMYYLFPFNDLVIVEFRRYMDGRPPQSRAVWRLRNMAWKTMTPAIGRLIRTGVPARAARDALFRSGDRIARQVMARFRADSTFAGDQIIRYPEKAGFDRYTFSIWAFPEEEFPRVSREYFAFCRQYYQSVGFRCDLPNVGYRIHQDNSALLSYTFDGTAMTLDPVSTGGPGWPEFLDAYNAFCTRNGGSPLFNQSARLTPEHVQAAYGSRLETFRQFSRRYDPDQRFVNSYFGELMGLRHAEAGLPRPEGLSRGIAGPVT